MDKFEEKSIDGKLANKERAEELRRQIAYLEAILPPKRGVPDA